MQTAFVGTWSKIMQIKLAAIGCICGIFILSGCSTLSASRGSAAASQVTAQTYAAGDEPLAFSPHDRSLAPQNDTYYFKYDNDTMSADDMRAADVQANYLAMHPGVKVRLEGHTDARGSAEYNIALGWRRAQSVAQRLEMQGVHPDQIKIVSYGKEKPAVLGDTAAAYAKNRRVNMVYQK